jgi:hypothetical protein
MNEDLNNPISNKRNQYLLDFIRETQLAYNNSSKTFVNSMGQEASEIDFCSLSLACKLILKEGGHLPFLVFRRLVFSLNHPVWAGQGDQFHFSK